MNIIYFHFTVKPIEKNSNHMMTSPVSVLLTYYLISAMMHFLSPVVYNLINLLVIQVVQRFLIASLSPVEALFIIMVSTYESFERKRKILLYHTPNSKI